MGPIRVLSAGLLWGPPPNTGVWGTLDPPGAFMCWTLSPPHSAALSERGAPPHIQQPLRTLPGPLWGQAQREASVSLEG